MKQKETQSSERSKAVETLVMKQKETQSSEQSKTVEAEKEEDLARLIFLYLRILVTGRPCLEDLCGGSLELKGN